MVLRTDRKITYEDWLEEFKPVLNHIDKNAPYDGYMFETYGVEEDYIRSYPDQTKVWTLFDTDNGLVLESGFGYVNRMGYFITEVSHENKCIWSNTEEDD